MLLSAEKLKKTEINTLNLVFRKKLNENKLKKKTVNDFEYRNFMQVFFPVFFERNTDRKAFV